MPVIKMFFCCKDERPFAPTKLPTISIHRKEINMFTTYYLQTSEIEGKLGKSIRGLFGREKVKITVSEVDETDYLLQNEANRQVLERSLKDAKERRNLHTFDLKDIK